MIHVLVVFVIMVLLAIIIFEITQYIKDKNKIAKLYRKNLIHLSGLQVDLEFQKQVSLWKFNKTQKEIKRLINKQKGSK